MGDEALWDSDEEVFCGPITSRELELMAKRKLWFRKTEVFKQTTPRKSQQSQGNVADLGEEETNTSASTSGLKTPNVLCVIAQDGSVDPEEMCPDSPNKSFGTQAPPSTPEPCFDVYKSTTTESVMEGFKQMTHINEEEHLNSLAMITSSPGAENINSLDATDVCVEALADILESFTDSDSSDSYSSFKGGEDYTSKIGFQNEDVQAKLDVTYFVNEAQALESHLNTTNDNLEDSIVNAEDDKSEFVQFVVDDVHDLNASVGMSQEKNIEKVQEDGKVMNQLLAYKNNIQELSESSEVSDEQFVGNSYLEIGTGNDNFMEEMVEVPEVVNKSLKENTNFVIMKDDTERTCDDNSIAGDYVEVPEQSRATPIKNQEGNNDKPLEMGNKVDDEENLDASMENEDPFDDLPNSSFQTHELSSFVNTRKKKYSTFFRSSNEDEIGVIGPTECVNQCIIPDAHSSISCNRCSILTTMDDELLHCRSNVAEQGVLASSPTLDKLAEISKKYQLTESDSAKPEKENYFLNALHRRYGNAKLTTRMSDLSLRSPRGGHNSTLSSLNESHESENSPGAKSTGSKECFKPLMPKCHDLDLSSQSDMDVVLKTKHDVLKDSTYIATPENPALNIASEIQSANYSMISDPEECVTNNITTGLPQDVKMFSVLNTMESNEESGDKLTRMLDHNDFRTSWSKTLPGNISSVSADDDGGFLGGFTEIALLHAALHPKSSTPKKDYHPIRVSMEADSKEKEENMEPSIAHPGSPSSEFNDTLEDMLLMETYGLDYMLGSKDRFSKLAAAKTTCDQTAMTVKDSSLTDKCYGLLPSIKFNIQHSKEPSLREDVGNESRLPVFGNRLMGEVRDGQPHPQLFGKLSTCEVDEKESHPQLLLNNPSTHEVDRNELYHQIFDSLSMLEVDGDERQPQLFNNPETCEVDEVERQPQLFFINPVTREGDEVELQPQLLNSPVTREVDKVERQPQLFFINPVTCEVDEVERQPQLFFINPLTREGDEVERQPQLLNSPVTREVDEVERQPQLLNSPVTREVDGDERQSQLLNSPVTREVDGDERQPQLLNSPVTREVDGDERQPQLLNSRCKSMEKSSAVSAMQLDTKPQLDISRPRLFSANSSHSRVRLFTDLVSSRSTEDNTNDCSTSPGVKPVTPDAKTSTKPVAQLRKFFSDKSSSITNEHNLPKIKQAGQTRRDFVFIKPKIVITKPQANYNQETTPVKNTTGLPNKMISPRVKAINQCSRGLVSPLLDKSKPTCKALQSAPGSRIPMRSPVVKKNPNFSNIQSPIGAYIKNSPTPSLVTNMNMPVVSATKKIVTTGTFSNQKKRLFPDIISPKVEATSVHYGSENVDTNNVGSILPQVSYQSAPSLKLDTPSKMKMPHISESLKRLVDVPMTRVLKHEGRVKVSSIQGGMAAKPSPYRLMPRLAPSDPNDSCVAPNSQDGEISVVVSKEVTRTDTIGH